MASRRPRKDPDPEPEPSPAPEPEAEPAPAPTPEVTAATPRERLAAINVKVPPKFDESRFDKFTERAKKVLVLSQTEAKRFNHNYIGTEHLLLGLVAEGEGIAAKVLTNLKVGLDQVRSSVEFIIGRGDRMVIGDISLTPRAKKVIELAIDEARQLNHNYIGTEHLLLGLIREGEGIAAGVLESLGVDMEGTRAQILDIISKGLPNKDAIAGAAGGSLASFAGAKGSVVTCRIASDDLEALDALIEAGIRSTRSDAAAWLIHAGIQANLDLFDKVYTTVAEIKRLREQAQTAAKDLESKDKPPSAT
jgi:ATP-dependent Clp protease ATP-binding subunit ClpA